MKKAKRRHRKVSKTSDAYTIASLVGAPKAMPVRLVTALTWGASTNVPETILLFYDDGSIEKIEPIHIGKFRRSKLIEETLAPTPLK